MASSTPVEPALAYATPRGRGVLAATVLGSGLAFIDATVVNVALPRIGEALGAGMSGLTWTINGYMLTLASLILLGGSLGDRFGRKRIFLIGVVWFAVASLLCGLAPGIHALIAARALQGVGGALLTPGSLALLQASFRPEDRAQAIGAWSGLGGIAGAAGPFLGGWLVQVASWRWVFLINLPVALAVVVLTLRCVPESKDPAASQHLDVPGAVLGAVGLGSLTWGLIAWQDLGAGSHRVQLLLALGVLALAGFLLREHRAKEPMLPLGLFASPLFSAVNAVTFVVYAALGGMFFWLVLALQVVAGFSPLVSGLALLPVTVVMLLLSARMGALAQRIGPRLPMTVGPLIAALGTAALTRVHAGSTYVGSVLPPVLLFGLGLSLTVAPLTATVLAAAPVRHAGLASGVNNAVARVAGLLAVAVLPLVAGLSGEAYSTPALLQPAYHRAMWLCAALLALGGLLAALFVRRPLTAPAPATPRGPCHHCCVDAPPLTQ
ncbi:MFS transporter [Aggregicoccus sp. 17bor-14]|uniref:MFS transporter n=1 Tax=Myxococcaceae TaxID=31 RepID=UPI00129CFB29|nr:MULTISPECIES: MFS transporter [Myxococcaceae]MBF5042050.1 MFS transporter [Simulacricoccus sp. 17bor-14]MRI87828.1 MFS transporter [Aggregicoccus sp. 17bor-14]